MKSLSPTGANSTGPNVQNDRPPRVAFLRMLCLGLLWGAATLLPACTSMSRSPVAEAQSTVFAAERAFARSMAERDLVRFGDAVSEEAVFFTGPTPLRGKAQVVGYWARWFEGPQAPFSWEPDQVEVLESGTLALSTGPVRDASGKLIGRFNSIWRREADGHWRVVFDKGSPPGP